MRLNYDKVEPILKLALQEDIGSGDRTTEACIPKNLESTAVITAKEEGIICGLDLISFIFRLRKTAVSIQLLYQDGSTVHKGKIIAIIKGSTREILMTERVILNFLQQLSGVATLAHHYQQAVQHTNVKILDTRKTIPGMRYLQKYAVKCGGAENHRRGLYDMVLIKDNHISTAGTISKAVSLCREKNPSQIKIEVECTSLQQVKEALATDCDWIMLDNMNIADMKNSLKLINHKKKVEISGGITLQNLPAVAKLGTDFISVGALTHSYHALDISMDILKPGERNERQDR